MLEEEIELEDLSVGVVSVGDILLNNLKQQIEAAGVTVEFRLTASGGVLVCGSQVSVKIERNWKERMREREREIERYRERQYLEESASVLFYSDQSVWL